jgi:hypothetical protein
MLLWWELKLPLYNNVMNNCSNNNTNSSSKRTHFFGMNTMSNFIQKKKKKHASNILGPSPYLHPYFVSCQQKISKREDK